MRSPRRRSAATFAAAGVIGAGASLLASAGTANAATGSVSDIAIAQHAVSAGLPGCSGGSLATWVAVALAESGGNPHAHATVGEDSRGLWQINMRAHGGWVGNHNLYNPSTNAWAARQVCSGQGLSAWSTYTNGAMNKFIARGQAAAAAVGGGGLSVRSAAYTPVATAPVASVSSGYPSLAAGSGYRADVREIQQALADLGYPISVDGRFGYQTNHMVKDYQLKHGLFVDGVVGPRTRASLGL